MGTPRPKGSHGDSADVADVSGGQLQLVQVFLVPVPQIPDTGNRASLISHTSHWWTKPPIALNASARLVQSLRGLRTWAEIPLHIGKRSRHSWYLTEKEESEIVASQPSCSAPQILFMIPTIPLVLKQIGPGDSDLSVPAGGLGSPNIPLANITHNTCL